MLRTIPKYYLILVFFSKSFAIFYPITSVSWTLFSSPHSKRKSLFAHLFTARENYSDWTSIEPNSYVSVPCKKSPSKWFLTNCPVAKNNISIAGIWESGKKLWIHRCLEIDWPWSKTGDQISESGGTFTYGGDRAIMKYWHGREGLQQAHFLPGQYIFCLGSRPFATYLLRRRTPNTAHTVAIMNYGPRARLFSRFFFLQRSMNATVILFHKKAHFRGCGKTAL